MGGYFLEGGKCVQADNRRKKGPITRWMDPVMLAFAKSIFKI